MALELNAPLLLIDDKKARRIAQERGAAVAGTLGVLRLAHERGLVKMDEALPALIRLGFRSSPALMRQILADLPDVPRQS